MSSAPAAPIRFIDLQREYEEHKSDFVQAVTSVMDSTQFILGPQVAECEKRLAEFVGAKYCLTVSSGTDSLQIALMALGVGPGDEVITCPFTWISSAEVIALVGARPVFVDIDPVSFNIDAAKLEAAIKPGKTKAIMPISLFGQLPDQEAILQIAQRHGIPVVEDGAQSFGATRNGKTSCSGQLSTIASTSFFPAKPLGCYGDGGAVFTDDEQLYTKMKAIRNHGALVRYEHHYIGMNGRCDTMQCAVLNVKLNYFHEHVAARNRIGARYTELLRGKGCVPPEVLPGNTHVYAQYTVRVKNRDRVVEELRARGVPCAVYYPNPLLHVQPCFQRLGYAQGDFPVAEKAGDEVMSLPMHPYLTDAEQDYIVAQLIDAIQAANGHYTQDDLHQLPANARVNGVHENTESKQPKSSSSSSSNVSESAQIAADAYVHPSAYVDGNAVLESGSKVWHFSHVMSGSVIGAGSNLGQNCFVGHEVRIGANVKVQNNVSIYHGVQVEDDAFLGPSCVFTNDLWPRSSRSSGRDWQITPTYVRRGASIGANATVVCGSELGQYCLVGAGAVVTKSVAPFALVVGSPAKQIGWVSHDGTKLDLPVSSDSALEATCPHTSRKYRLENNSLVAL